MPDMDLGDLASETDARMGLFKMMMFMTTPWHHDHRRQIEKTWIARTLGAMADWEPMLIETARSTMTRVRQETALKDDPKLLGRAEAFEDMAEMLGEMGARYSRYAVQEKFFDPDNGFEAVAKAPGLGPICLHMEQAGDSAILAGAILWTVLQIQQHHASVRPGGTSVGKAMHVMLHEPRWNNRKLNPTRLTRAWGGYWPVAHLWAAAIHIYLEELGKGPALPRLGDDFDPFMRKPYHTLRIAKAFEQLFLGITVHPNDTPLADPKEIWRLPKFKGDKAPTAIVFPPLSPQGAEALRTYRAEPSIMTGSRDRDSSALLHGS